MKFFHTRGGYVTADLLCHQRPCQQSFERLEAALETAQARGASKYQNPRC